MYPETEKLHSNHLKILRFMEPNGYIKKWVEDDIYQTGHFHDMPDWIFPVVEKIEAKSTRVIPIEFVIKNGVVQICVYKSMRFPVSYYFYNQVDYIGSSDKTFAIYEACIAFIDWWNTLDEDAFIKQSVGSYVTPNQVLLRKDILNKNRVFVDDVAIGHLKTVTCDIFNITQVQLESKSRVRDVVKARMLIMTILNLDGYTCSMAGMVFRKDHATVIHARKAILDMIDTKDNVYYDKIMQVLDVFGISKILERAYTNQTIGT